MLLTTGGGKAQHEAIKREVMRMAACVGEGVVSVVATVTMTTVEIAQGQHGLRGLLPCGGGRMHLPRDGRDVCHEAAHPKCQCEHGQEKHRGKQTHQAFMRKNIVKTHHTMRRQSCER